MGIHPKISWCNKNAITIYPLPIKNNKKVLIEINDKGKIKTGKNLYVQDGTLAKKIHELYEYYFNKYNQAP